MVQPYGNDRSWPIIMRYPTVCSGPVSKTTKLLRCLSEFLNVSVVTQRVGATAVMKNVSSRTDGQTLGVGRVLRRLFAVATDTEDEFLMCRSVNYVEDLASRYLNSLVLMKGRHLC